jgi:hypothetical protein
VQDTISEWPVAANVVLWWLSRSVIGTVGLVAAEFAQNADSVRVVSRLVSRVVTDRSASYAWQPAERACAGNRPFGR